jgi:fatty-acid desaturase
MTIAPLTLLRPYLPVEDPEEPPHPYDWRTVAVLITVHAGVLLAPFFFTPTAALLGLFLYVLTALGITLGYHRLLTHRSFKTPKWCERLIVFIASQSAQAGPVAWVAIHRTHHAHADQEGDPHSTNGGFWWAHMGWMLVQTPRKMDPEFIRRFAPDIASDPFYAFVDKHFFKMCLGTGVLFYLLGGWPWVFWGMFVRIAGVFHATWLVNSAAHTYGYRSHQTRDNSTNCWWVALLALGEGWHNNHHAFPISARHGLKWYELDFTWGVIQLMKVCGLAWAIKGPPKSQLPGV